MSPIAHLKTVVLDCADHHALAAFYAVITGWDVGAGDEDDWVELVSPSGPNLAFQQVDDHRPPTWPSSGQPQQLHLDFYLDDLDAGEAAVLAAGAVKAKEQPGTTFRVFLDPAGHPFCLCEN